MAYNSSSNVLASMGGLLMSEVIDDIENNIDNWLYNALDPSIPRNKYIYNCNLAYIDLVVDQKVLFSPLERHYLFSLNYNTLLLI